MSGKCVLLFTLGPAQLCDWKKNIKNRHLNLDIDLVTFSCKMSYECICFYKRYHIC